MSRGHSHQVTPLLARTSALTTALLAAASLAASAQAPPPPPQVDARLGNGVTIRSVDDQASLNIRARIQTRATLVGYPRGTRADTSEFLIRRARLVFQGNAAGPAFTYYLQLSFANLDNEADLRLPLRDAYVTWSGARDFNVRVGQMKVPFSRQRVVSSSALQMVDRSIVVSELNLDRDVGVQVFSRNLLGVDKLGYAVGLFGGEGRNRLGRAAGLLYTARLEAWPLGGFDDLVEGDQRRTSKLRLALGGSVAYNQNTNRPRSTIGTPYSAGDFDYRHAGVDLTLKWSGWSMASELLYRQADRPVRTVAVGGVPTAINARSGWGAYLQGGRMVSQRIELTARYSHLAPRSGSDPAFVASDELGAGLSYYLHGHDVKVQGDYFSLSDATSAQRTQQARVQLQLFF